MTNLVDRQCWCGSVIARDAGTFVFDDGERFALVRCEGCGVMALFPPPSDAELITYYSSEYYGASRTKFIGPVARVISMFQGGRARLAARHAPRGGRVLDIGCGNGGFLIQMKSRGFMVEGTEWTADSAARVPKAEGIRIHVGDLLALDLPQASFDLITLWHVFEHLRQPREMLMKIRKLLKPGGNLLMSMPNAESVQAKRFGTAWLHHDPPRHLFGFGPKSLTRLLNDTGFQVQSINTFSLEQNPFGYVQSWLNARGNPRDRLYTMLKGQGRESFSAKIADLFWLAALGVPALVISSMESMRGNGATMTVCARPTVESDSHKSV